MKIQEREHLVSRIASRYMLCKLSNDARVKLYSPDAEQLYLASELYNEVFKEALFEDVPTRQDVLSMMIDSGLWSLAEANELDTLEKKLDDLKVELYNASFRSDAIRTLREAIRVTISRIDELRSKKSKFDIVTAEGIAAFAKSSQLILSGLRRPDGEKYETEDSRIIVDVVNYCNDYAISETQYRELARTEPFSSMYVASEREGSVFGRTASELTIEQRILLFWCRVYRNIHESIDCPHDSIIEDDWMLDGWMIRESRKRESEQKKKSAEDLIQGSDKIRNASEIFIPVDTIEDARKLNESLNSAEARAIIASRQKAIHEHGELKEHQLPDVKRQIMMDFNNMYAERAKAK